jgi:hypothetical protein
VSDRLDDAETLLRRERRRTVDEREAFEAFCRRVESIPPDDAPELGTGTVLVAGPTAANAERVADAYRETVMSVPHYADDYGDSYADSVSVEFGESVAVALESGFDESTKRGVLSAARDSRAERVRLVSALDAERESLADARAFVAETLDELGEYRTDRLDEGFGALDARRARLEVLADRCDEAAAARQADIRANHATLGLPERFPDLPTYLYQSLDERHPALATLAELGDVVASTRRRVERRMYE